MALRGEDSGAMYGPGIILESEFLDNVAGRLAFSYDCRRGLWPCGMVRHERCASEGSKGEEIVLSNGLGLGGGVDTSSSVRQGFLSRGASGPSVSSTSALEPVEDMERGVFEVDSDCRREELL